jgi:hypothetical protein
LHEAARRIATDKMISSPLEEPTDEGGADIFRRNCETKNRAVQAAHVRRWFSGLRSYGVMPAGVKRNPKLARMARTFSEQDILRLLRAAVEQEGNQSAFAKRYGVQRTSINLILAGKRPVSGAIKDALGLRRTYTDAE